MSALAAGTTSPQLAIGRFGRLHGSCHGSGQEFLIDSFPHLNTSLAKDALSNATRIVAELGSAQSFSARPWISLRSGARGSRTLHAGASFLGYGLT